MVFRLKLQKTRGIPKNKSAMHLNFSTRTSVFGGPEENYR